MYDPKSLKSSGRPDSESPRSGDINRDDQENTTSRPVAEEATPEPDHITHESVTDHEVNPNVKNADRPKGVDKPDGELESLNDDLKRVEKRTTM